jgi:hypothetical protein
MLESTIQALATILAALIVGVAGGLISRQYARERDRQDKETQWRQHAIELTKLDLERKLKGQPPDGSKPLRPSILDFLANYRDLQELGEATPKALYEKIIMERMVGKKKDEEQT